MCPLLRQRTETAATAGSSLTPQSRCRGPPDWQPRCPVNRIYLSPDFLPLETHLLPFEPFIRSSFVSRGQQSSCLISRFKGSSRLHLRSAPASSASSRARFLASPVHPPACALAWIALRNK